MYMGASHKTIRRRRGGVMTVVTLSRLAQVG